MKKVLLLFIILFSTTSFSQKDPNIYDFFGGKSFKNDTVFFRLVFQIEDGNVSGYMYTDEQGESETKSIIEGKFNYETKRISFIETRKLLSRMTNGFQPLCFVQGNVSLELSPQISKLKGAFIEQTLANKKCINGDISLISPDAYKKLKEQIEVEKQIKIEQTVVKVKKVKTSIKKESIIIPSFDSDKKTTIKGDEEIVVYWSSNKINLSIWDDMKEDGDEISISFNDEVILDKYELKNKKKEIELELTTKENKLVFTANSTGLLADNTARVDLFDNKLKHQIITELKLNKSVTVIIKKQ